MPVLDPAAVVHDHCIELQNSREAAIPLSGWRERPSQSSVSAKLLPKHVKAYVIVEKAPLLPG